MNRLKLYLLALTALAVCSAKADEGMWLLQLMQQQHSIDMMKKQGLKLEAQDLYNPNGVSLKDAVGIFGGGCTGEIISPEGLILTNHHCGYASIQQHSSVEHDYLTDGFWATSRDKELPTPGLKFTFIERIEDITDIVNLRIAAKEITESESFSSTFLNKLAKELFEKSDLKGKKGIVPQALPFYAGNKFYMFYKKVYPDVRMVAAPPSSIGKFGGETDNWMWPRHTGDFSMFRIYADANGEPAEYSASNVPLKTKKHLNISIKGLKEGDYAMIMGFPGSTSRYLTVSEVKERMEASNAPRIRIRGTRQDVLKEAMNASDKVRIQYANKYAGSSNYWKNSIGMNKCIDSIGLIQQKRDYEFRIKAYVDSTGYLKGQLNFDTLKALYAQNSTASHDLLLLSESFSRTNELTTRAMMGAQGPNVVRNEKKPSKSYLLYDDDQKTWDEGLDKEVLAVSLKNYKEHIADVRNLPAFYTTIANEYGNDYRRFVDDIWSKTVLMKNNKRIYFNNKAFDKDPGVRLGKDLKEVAERLKKALGANTERIEDQERMLCAAKLRMEEDMPHYSDANFTMRLSYGRVGGYNIGGQPSGYYTASESIVEKMKAGDKGVIDYQAEPIMHELMSASNYGPYADKTTGKMQLCLLTNNDITGGNSGSPLFDGQGRLIGLAFDGNWDSLASDIMFDKVLARTISVDIRFVLYLMDRWGHADRLLQEIGAK